MPAPVKALLVLLVLAVLAVFVVPIPEYQTRAYCFMAGPGCGAEGWRLGPPFWTKIKAFLNGGKEQLPNQKVPPSATPAYTCPQTEWVNCMPILTPETQKSCTKEYLDWATKNCSNFKGAAY